MQHKNSIALNVMLALKGLIRHSIQEGASCESSRPVSTLVFFINSKKRNQNYAEETNTVLLYSVGLLVCHLVQLLEPR